MGNDKKTKKTERRRISAENGEGNQDGQILLIYPIFVREGNGIREEIPSMPGQYRYSLDQMPYKLERLTKAGVGSVMLFGIPDVRMKREARPTLQDGIVQRAIRQAKKRFPDLYYVTDVCLCEYTSHGHCGMLCGHEVENDSTVETAGKNALSHVQAGADMVAPSDMMDGSLAGIRRLLDENGHKETPIMSYAVKYASAFYGPFREAAGSAPAFGDRKSYQMDPHNSREGVKEALLDVEEGADIVMVKPALAYLDMITKVKEVTNVPVAAYSTSGEYAMVKAAAANGWVDQEQIICEMAVGAYRAGSADLHHLLRQGTGKMHGRRENRLMRRSEELFDRAVKVIPGGVNSPVRAYGSVGMTPRFIEGAQGPYIFDADGKKYIDYIGSWGPMILGHNNRQCWTR